jgi:hypothetical protein
MAGSRSNEHLQLAVAFEQRATTTKPSRLRANLLKLAKLYRELAVRAELRQRISENRAARARRSGRTKATHPA